MRPRPTVELASVKSGRSVTMRSSSSPVLPFLGSSLPPIDHSSSVLTAFFGSSLSSLPFLSSLSFSFSLPLLSFSPFFSGLLSSDREPLPPLAEEGASPFPAAAWGGHGLMYGDGVAQPPSARTSPAARQESHPQTSWS